MSMNRMCQSMTTRAITCSDCGASALARAEGDYCRRCRSRRWARSRAQAEREAEPGGALAGRLPQTGTAEREAAIAKYQARAAARLPLFTE